MSQSQKILPKSLSSSIAVPSNKSFSGQNNELFNLIHKVRLEPKQILEKKLTIKLHWVKNFQQ